MWIKQLRVFGIIALLIILAKGFKGFLAVLAIVGTGLILCVAMWLVSFLFMLILTKSFKETWNSLKPSEMFKEINKM
jgi:hypothetical protein